MKEMKIWDAESFEEEMRLYMFCTEYCKTLNFEEAAAKVGLKQTRKQVLERDSVKQVLSEMMARRARRLEIDADKIVMELMTNAEYARARGDVEASNQSLKIIAEYLGMVNQKTPQGGPAGGGTAIVFGTGFVPAVAPSNHDALPSSHLAADTDAD